MRWLIRLGLAGVVLAWLGVELAAPPLAERIIADEVNSRYRDAATVKVDISSFPLVTRVALTETIGKLTVTLDQIARQSLTYGEVRFELHGIVIDRAATLGGDPRVRRIDRGSVTATIDASALGGLPSFEGAGVRVAGRTLTAGATTIAIDPELVPCDPQVRTEDDRVILTCTFDEVPQSLLRAAQSG